jgi:Ca2+-transporting ATPase
MKGSTSRNGLTKAEAVERRRRFGSNKLAETKGRSALVIYAAQFKNPLIYIISVAFIISVVLTEYEDALIIGVVILLDSILGFFQEYRAQKTVLALRRLLKPLARVIRDGETVEIEVADIVPDDLVTANPGDRIAADGELVEAISLTVNEAILTGESEPIPKGVDDIVYMGTSVSSGRGLFKVTATGMKTELGKIAESLAEIKEKPTPLQLRLHRFGKTLTYMVITICLIIFVTGLILGKNPLQMITLSVVLAIAAIPEGLLIAVTMILAIGMRAVLRRKGLVKKLLAVETLGSVTVICTDKTGTLTEGIMQVSRTDFGSEEMAAHVMALCNDLADSLETTLWAYVKSLRVDPQGLAEEHERLYEVPFTSENKYMLTTNSVDGSEVAFVKGAPEIVLNFCNVQPKERKQLAIQFEEWASSGLKLLGLAYKQNGNPRELADFTWTGLVGIEDPVRPTVKDAIKLCRSAGIKTKMVTGDYRGTAEKVARTLGLATQHSQILEGKEIELMTDGELTKAARHTVVFCRVSPHHKLRIVNALQNTGEVTAMIGDGVNDAPALKKADIGVSVGNATDVAQETASLILLDNNFETLVGSVEEGRIIFDNIKKVVAYVLSNSFAEIITIFGAFLLGWPAPLTIAQILWIHLICDGPSDIALGFERAEKGIMEEQPKPVTESVLDRSSKFLVVAISFSSAVLCLLMFQHFWQIHEDIVLGQTVVFTVLGTQEMIYIFSYRSLRTSIFRSGNFLANRVLLATVALGLGQQLLALYVPPVSGVLGVVPLGLVDWASVLAVSFAMMAIVEVVKLVARHKGRKKQVRASASKHP